MASLPAIRRPMLQTPMTTNAKAQRPRLATPTRRSANPSYFLPTESVTCSTGSGQPGYICVTILHGYLIHLTLTRRTHMPPTGSFGLPRCWHPRVSCLLLGGLSPLRRSWSRVTVQGMSENPAGAPGCRRASRMDSRWPGCRPAAWRPRAIRGRGRAPAPDHPAGTALERRGGQSCPVSVAGAQEVRRPARPHPNPAVTLSDMGGRGERTHSRRSALLSELSPLEPLATHNRSF
jgi:hypothetical protein